MKTVTFTGHRPKSLCGYDGKAYAGFVRDLAMFLKDLYPGEILRVVTGGAQGIDQLAFWAADLAKDHRSGIVNVVYVPFRGQDSVWKETGTFSRTEYAHMLDAADEVCYLMEKPSGKGGVVKALNDRNHRMVDTADELIAIYDGADYRTERSGTAECMRYAAGKKKPIRVVPYKIENGRLEAKFQ